MTAKVGWLTLWVVATLVAGGGCAADSKATAKSDRTKRSSAASPLNSNTDPCAMRLHDACAPLLLYFGRHQTLPANAEELAQVPGVELPQLTCPVSNKKYIYNPHGPSGPETGTRIILYDATPAHAGRRWGIAVKEPAPGQALVAKVVVLPESIFSRP